jgi:hypothetical protein
MYYRYADDEFEAAMDYLIDNVINEEEEDEIQTYVLKPLNPEDEMTRINLEFLTNIKKRKHEVIDLTEDSEDEQDIQRAILFQHDLVIAQKYLKETVELTNYLASLDNYSSDEDEDEARDRFSNYNK